MENNLKWSFAGAWNYALEQGKPDRVQTPRDKIWASELGGAFIDRWLKMRATTYTNPPNLRSKRKFEAGNLMEWLVGRILHRIGLTTENQKWLEYQYPGLLPVSGKFDFSAGGLPNWDTANAELTKLELPEFFTRATQGIIEHLKKICGDGLTKIVLEVKSCSGSMFEVYERKGANKNHELQVYHYLKSSELQEGHIVYISKDDLRILEFGVMNPTVRLEANYRNDIEKMTDLHRNAERPPLEKVIIFDDLLKKFVGNWKVGYSNYLDLLYNFNNQHAFEKYTRPMTARWNRVMGRLARGERITPKNEEVLNEILLNGFDPDELKNQIEVKEEELNDD